MITIRPTYEAKRIQKDIPTHLERHKKALEDAFHEIGQEVVYETKRLILNPPKTGRIYIINGRWHQASAPGEAPAWLTGRLGRSGDYFVTSYERMVVGEDPLKAPYSGYLEHGTKKMAPRPHVIKAIQANHQNMVNAILDNVEKAINR